MERSISQPAIESAKEYDNLVKHHFPYKTGELYNVKQYVTIALHDCFNHLLIANWQDNRHVWLVSCMTS